MKMTDRLTIKDVFTHYPPGERVKALRRIFRSEITDSHFLYLGELIGEERARYELAKFTLHIRNIAYQN